MDADDLCLLQMLPDDQKQYVCKYALDGKLPEDVKSNIMSQRKYIQTPCIH